MSTQRAVVETKPGIKLLITTDYNPHLPLAFITTHEIVFIGNAPVNYFDKAGSFYYITQLDQFLPLPNDCLLYIAKHFGFTDINKPVYWYDFT